MAFASPALDFGFAPLSSLREAAGSVAAHVQAAAEFFTRQAKALVENRIGSRAASVEHSRSADMPAPARTAPRAAQPMTLADQWSKVTTVLVQSVDSARIATEMQSAATQQLDLAQYGLITLVDELSAVMTMPGRRSRTATVHPFSATGDSNDLLSGGHALAA